MGGFLIDPTSVIRIQIGIPWFQFFVLFRCRHRLDPAKTSSVPMEEEEAIKVRDNDRRNHKYMFLVEMYRHVS